MKSKILASFYKDEDGVIAIIFAILLPIIVSALALGAETGYWYFAKGQLQQVADISVRTAAINLQSSVKIKDVRNAVDKIAKENGLADTGLLLINHPPAYGHYSGNADYVEVVVELQKKRLFSSIFNSEPLMIGARSVARFSGGKEVCVLALSKSAEPAIQMNILSQIDLHECSMASNSRATMSIIQSIGSRLQAACIQATGGAHLLNTIVGCPKVKEYERPVTDPYADHIWIDTQNLPCRQPDFTKSGTTQLHPMDEIGDYRAMRICGGLRLSGNVKLSAGIYVIDGEELEADSTASVQGEDVTFVLENGAVIELGMLASLNLSAPKRGPLRGLLFIDQRLDDDTVHQIDARSVSNSIGAVYAPGSTVELKGLSPHSRPCIQVIADRVILSGIVNITSSCRDSGMRKLTMGREISLAE